MGPQGLPWGAERVRVHAGDHRLVHCGRLAIKVRDAHPRAEVAVEIGEDAPEIDHGIDGPIGEAEGSGLDRRVAGGVPRGVRGGGGVRGGVECALTEDA